MKFQKKSKGFTLIELLVVVAIIGVLATVVLSSLSAARERAKFTKFQSGVNAFQAALELYHLDNGEYPSSGPSGSVGFFTNPFYHAQYTNYAGFGWLDLISDMEPYFDLDQFTKDAAIDGVMGSYMAFISRECTGLGDTTQYYGIIFTTTGGNYDLSDEYPGPFSGAAETYHCVDIQK
jgi:type II secretion system protein G